MSRFPSISVSGSHPTSWSPNYNKRLTSPEQKGNQSAGGLWTWTVTLILSWVCMQSDHFWTVLWHWFFPEYLTVWSTLQGLDSLYNHRSQFFKVKYILSLSLFLSVWRIVMNIHTYIYIYIYRERERERERERKSHFFITTNPNR